MPLKILIIAWPIGRPPAERPGGAEGWSPPDFPEKSAQKFKTQNPSFSVKITDFLLGLSNSLILTERGEPKTSKTFINPTLQFAVWPPFGIHAPP